MPIEDEASVEFHLPAKDSLGRSAVDGKIRFADKTLFVHWKLRDRTFTRTQNKLQTREFGVGEVEELRLDKGWFKTVLFLEIKDPRPLDEMPGVDMGKLEIRLPKSARAEAEKLVSVFDFERSQWRADDSRRRLRELEQSENG